MFVLRNTLEMRNLGHAVFLQEYCMFHAFLLWFKNHEKCASKESQGIARIAPCWGQSLRKSINGSASTVRISPVPGAGETLCEFSASPHAHPKKRACPPRLVFGGRMRISWELGEIPKEIRRGARKRACPPRLAFSPGRGIP